MPRRSNLFQDVVLVVHRLLADGAEVEESVMLPHHQTGDMREVDVVVRSRVAGQEIVIGIEATGSMGSDRPADVGWVEQLMCKHRGLPIDRTILVSETGYTAQARRLADANRIAVVDLSDLDNESGLEGAIIGKLVAMWPKAVRLTPQRVIIHLHRPESNDHIKLAADPDVGLYANDGTELGNIDHLLRARTSDREWLFEQIGLADTTESSDQYFTLGAIRPEFTHSDGRVIRDIYTRFTADDGEVSYHRLEQIEATGRAEIEVHRLDLKHRRLGEVTVAYGETTLFGNRTSLIVANEGSGETATIRVHGYQGQNAATEFIHPLPEQGPER